MFGTEFSPAELPLATDAPEEPQGQAALAPRGLAHSGLELSIGAENSAEIIRQDLREVAVPAIRRRAMLPHDLERNPARRLCRSFRRRGRAKKARSADSAAKTPARTAWRAATWRRRGALAGLITLQTTAATWSFSNTFPYPWLRTSEILILAVFAILFAWISLGFWSAAAGFWTLWRGRREFTVADLPVDENVPLRSRTAVLMPICNEDVDRVFSGLEASFCSLARTAHSSSFDFFILSDTPCPEKQAAEQTAWLQTCNAVRGFGRIFYRHRRNNIRRKSGNIADFLRRWGSNYDYMIVFDADSVMTGETLVRLARMMDHYPRAGIIQSAPAAVNCDSFFARVQQFAGRAYGPMLTAGQRFWQLGEGYYWGHNAIIRVAPFMQHCGLARLPGKAPLGGEFMSHDFVEAALMGRAGWEVWVIHDLAGSYEEPPPTLADELKRDRRWCQGNLQHLKLFMAEGIRGGHRAILAMGIMAYASALLWFLFLVLNTVELAAWSITPLIYFSAEPSLFPVWPRWRPEWALGLLTTTAVLLFLPKWLSWLLIVKNRHTHLFGGIVPLSASIVLEIIVSTLLAPVRMWFHSQFVVITLMGRQIRWDAQLRTDNETGWRDALRLHGVSTALAAVWLLSLFWIDPKITVWLLPVAVSLLLSVPLAVYSSRIGLGRLMRRWRLFLIPEEARQPGVLAELNAAVKRRRGRKPLDPFVQVVVDPCANAVHVGLLRGKTPRSHEAIERNRSLCESAVTHGPASLGPRDKAHLLRDARSMTALHRRIWRMRDPAVGQLWGLGELQ